MKMSDNRIQYIDMAKGIGVIAVIIGHMNIWKLNHIIYSFHMPLFFLLAGYLLSQKYSVVEYAKRKFRQLIIPYVFTCIMIFMISVISDLFNGKRLDVVGTNLKKWFIASLYGSGNLEFGTITKIGAIWFLLAMFFACVFVRYVINKRNSFIIVLFVFFIGYISALYIWLPLSIQAGMTASLFVYIGYEARKKDLLQKKVNNFVLIVTFISWIFAIIFGSINMAKNYYKLLPLSIFGAICGSYIVIYCCMKIKSTGRMESISRIFTFFGRNSLVVLCFHLLELNFFPWTAFKELALSMGLNSILIIILQFTIKMLWASLAIVIVNRIKVLKRVFYM